MLLPGPKPATTAEILVVGILILCSTPLPHSIISTFHSSDPMGFIRWMNNDYLVLLWGIFKPILRNALTGVWMAWMYMLYMQTEQVCMFILSFICSRIWKNTAAAWHIYWYYLLSARKFPGNCLIYAGKIILFIYHEFQFNICVISLQVLEGEEYLTSDAPRSNILLPSKTFRLVTKYLTSIYEQ